MKRVVLLGATGSIGSSTFALLKRKVGSFQIVGASAHSRFADLEALAAEHSIEHLLDTRDEDGDGSKFKEFLKVCEADIVLNAVVGFAGLKYSLAILEAKVPLALANKESLVTGGGLLMDLAKQNKVPILPVDSEHSAIFQCLVDGAEYKPFNKILLTCSGGPFYGKTAEELSQVTKAQALAHPNWDMGEKISIDSATLANKSLEFFEAMHLFEASREQVEIVIHRQSIVHSMVEFADSSVIAQMSPPNMELPIAVALNHPDRVDYDLPRQDFSALDLSFAKPDKDVFRTLQVLDYCAERMENLPIIFNAVNEVAVEAFLNDQIEFTQIFDLLERVVEQAKLEPIDSLEKVFEVDKKARQEAQNVLEQL